MSARDVIARAILDLNPSAAHWDDQYPSVQLHKLEEADAILSALTAAGYAVVPREDAADHIEAIDMWLGDNADETPASVWGSINILRAMLAAGEATDDGR